MSRLSYADFEQAALAFHNQAKGISAWTLVEYNVRRPGKPIQVYLSLSETVCRTHQSPSASSSSLLTSSSIPVSSTDQDPVLQRLTVKQGGEDDEHELIDLQALGDITPDHANLDDPSFSPSLEQEFLTVSYNIVYSPSYQVPVLYFNAFKANGESISQSEIYSLLVQPDWRETVRSAGLNGGVSQQDHPVLNIPFFYMHPCDTATLMDTILDTIGSNHKFDSKESNHDGQNNTPIDLKRSKTLDSYLRIWLSLMGQAIGLAAPLEMFLEPTEEFKHK